MFSPYYRRARVRPDAAIEPLDHSAINVALYGRGGHRWAMTERRRGSVVRDATNLAIGRSELHWQRDALTVTLDEWTVPWPSPLRGCLRLHPQALTGHVETIAPGHHWTPFAPSARIEVLLEHPQLRWSGHAYFDGNDGNSPIEDAMQRWHWSRASLREQASAVLYDIDRRDGPSSSLALRFDRHGDAEPFAPPPRKRLARSGWRVDRHTRGDDACIATTLEDTPFYARSVLAATVCGERTLGVHESLDLDRFRRPVVQWMLPFRMPRARR